MRRRRIATAGFAAAAAAVVALGAAALPDPVVSDAAGATRTPRGCPELRPADHVPEAERVTTIVPADSAPTATDHLAPGLDVRAALSELRSLLAGFAPAASFELPSTGMAVTVLSDGPIEVDVDAFDRLLRLSLDDPDLFADGRVADVQRCYARRLLEEREFAGRPLRVFVPSEPAQCFRAGRLAPLGSDGFAASCDSSGVTLPELDLRPSLFGLELAEVTVPATVILTASAPPDDRDPDTRLAYLLLHELHHVVENGFGLTPWTGSLRHYEQRAYYVERAVRSHLTAAGVAVPRPIRFPGASDAQVAALEGEQPDGRGDHGDEGGEQQPEQVPPLREGVLTEVPGPR
jgi:hypothetical protein